MAASERVRRILFVCTGNTCRSPMAEALARRIALEQGVYLEVDSAGLAASDGVPAAVEASPTMDSLGLSLEGHNSRPIEPRDLERFDVILTMTNSQLQQLRQMQQALGPALAVAPRMDLLTRAAGEPGEIRDPIGQGMERYAEAAEQIGRAVGRFFAKEKAAGRLQPLRVALGADHGGFYLKEMIVEWLNEWGYEVEDFGTHSASSTDYPDYAEPVCEAVRSGRVHRGVLVCGSGIGMSIAANKAPGIRAAVCNDLYSARITRLDNDTNVLTLGARVVGEGVAEEIVRIWLTTPFAAGRHQRRVAKIDELARKWRRSSSGEDVDDGR